MARPTKKEQDMIRVRNEAIENLVFNKGFSQAEVARCFNMHRASVHQIIKEAESPMKLGDKLLKDYLHKVLSEAEEGHGDDYVTCLGLSWRVNQGVLKDFYMNGQLSNSSCGLWKEHSSISFINGHSPSTAEELEQVEKEMEQYKDMMPTKQEDIVITHKGNIIIILRIGKTFLEDEYPHIKKIAVPTGIVLALNEITDLSIFEV